MRNEVATAERLTGVSMVDITVFPASNMTGRRGKPNVHTLLQQRVTGGMVAAWNSRRKGQERRCASSVQRVWRAPGSPKPILMRVQRPRSFLQTSEFVAGRSTYARLGRPHIP